jgi:arsenate reductase
MGIQIFGTMKCPATRKAQRFFKDRGLAFQSIDLAEKGISPGELRAIAAALGPGGLERLADREGRRWKEGGWEHLEIDLEETLLANPLLLRTPLVRDGRRASVGEDSRAWAELASQARS